MSHLIRSINNFHRRIPLWRWFQRHWHPIDFVNSVRFHLPARRREAKRTPDAIQILNNLHQYAPILVGRRANGRSWKRLWGRRNSR
jgi:hypothetical protein